MAIETGLEWIVAIDDAESEGSPNWVDLPNQTDGTFEFGHTDVDVTHKGNSGWEDAISTRRTWTASAEGRSDQDDTALLFLIDTNFGGADTDRRVQVRLTNADGDTFVGWATMESLSITYPESDTVNYSVSFKGRGSVTVTRVA